MLLGYIIKLLKKDLGKNDPENIIVTNDKISVSYA